MFTGIIECKGTVAALEQESGNLQLWVQSPISDALKIDQSVAHNGVCLTVVERKPGAHRVTAVSETLARTNLGQLQVGSELNLERCMEANGRFDGHIVQGHVDDTAQCTAVYQNDGSWLYYFQLRDAQQEALVVDKGSICINGVSLTVVSVKDAIFHVTIIPYTHAHTTFGSLKAGDWVNIEFDILGKYIRKQLDMRA